MTENKTLFDTRTYADTTGIFEEYYLPEFHLYSDHIIASPIHKEESIITKTNVLNAENFNHYSMRDGLLNHYDFNYHLNDNSCYDEVKEKAKDHASDAEGTLVLSHQGNTKTTYEGKVQIKSDYSKSIHKSESAKNISVKAETIHSNLSGKTHKQFFKGGDVTYTSDVSTREAASINLIGYSGVNIAAENLTLITKDLSIVSDRYNVTYDTLTKVGNSSILANLTKFTSAKLASSINPDAKEIPKTKTNTIEDKIKEFYETRAKKFITPGLKTLQVIPRWRKIVEGGDDLESMAALSRLPVHLQAVIFDLIGEQYNAEDAVTDQAIPKSHSYTKWTTMLEEGFQARQAQLDAKIAEEQKHLNFIKNQLKTKQTFLDNNIDSKGDSHGAYENGLLDYRSTEKEIQPIEDRLVPLKQDKNNLANAQKHIEEEIKTLIKPYFSPEKPQQLMDGYLYVFAKHPNEPNYATPSLYKEYRYQVKEQSKGRHKVYIDELSEIDLSKEAGLDTRVETCSIEQYFDVPVYTDLDGNKQAFDVWVYYSSVQLSWARLRKFGGLSSNDPRYKSALSLNSSRKKLLDAVNSQSIDSTLLAQFATQTEKFTLANCYLSQSDNLPKKYNSLSPSIAQKGKQTTWQRLSLYYPTENDLYPCILLSDDLGILNEKNQQILFAQRRLSDLVSSMQNNLDMKGALLAYQFFFSQNSNGIYRITGNIFLDGVPEFIKNLENSYEEIEKGRNSLSEDKLKNTLKLHSRSFFKGLLLSLQKETLALFNQQSIQNHFINIASQGDVRYLNTHTTLWGLISPSLLDVDQVDDACEVLSLPVNEIVIDSKTLSNYSPYQSINIYLGYTKKRYYKKGHAIVLTTTTYTYDEKKKTHTCTQERTKLHKKLENPPYYNFLNDIVLNKDSWIGKLLYPKDDQPNFDLTLDQNIAYLEGEGKYNGVVLAHENMALAKLLASNDKTDSKANSKKLDDFKDDKLKDIKKTLINHVITGVIPFLAGQSSKLFDKLAPELAEELKLRHYRIKTDLYAFPRETITFKAGHVNNSQIRLVEYLVANQVNLENADLDVRIKDLSERNYRYSLNGDLNNLVDLSEAHANQREANNRSLKVLVEHLDESESKFTVIDETHKPKNLILKKALFALTEGERWNHFLGCLSGVQDIYSAYSDLSESYEKAEKKPNANTIIALGGKLAAAIKSTHEFNEKLLKLCNRESQYKEFITKIGFKDASLHSILKSNFTSEHNDLVESTEILLENRGLLKRAYYGMSVMNYIGLITSTNDLVSASLDWYKAQGQNDQAVALSNCFNMISKGFGVASAVKSTAQAMGYVANTQSENLLGIAVKKTMNKIMTETVVRSAAYESTLAFATEVIGILCPITDILTLGMFAFQMASIVVMLFKDNEYEVWAKGSQFTDQSYNKKFSSPVKEYEALLNLIALPSLTSEYSFDTKDYESSLAFPSTYTKNTQYEYKLFMTTKAEISANRYDENANHELDIAMTKTYLVALPIDIDDIEIFDIETNLVQGLSFKLSEAKITDILGQLVNGFTEWLIMNDKSGVFKTRDLTRKAIIDGIYQSQGAWYGTSQLFGIYALANFKDDDIQLPNTTLQELTMDKEDTIDSGISKLIQQGENYIMKKQLLSIFGAFKKEALEFSLGNLKSTIDWHHLLVKEDSLL